MRSFFFSIFVVVVTCWIAPVDAQQAQATQVERTQVTPSSINPLDDYTTLVTPLDRSFASLWKLTDEEAVRVRLLMKGIRGSTSVKNITPYEVLGIHARDDADRAKWAERYAQIMAEDTERVLQWTRAYSAAFERLYPGAAANMFGGASPKSAQPKAKLRK